MTFLQPSDMILHGCGGVSLGPQFRSFLQSLGAAEDVSVGIGFTIKQAIPEGVQNVRIHAYGLALEPEDHDAIRPAITLGKFFVVEQLSAVTGLMGITHEVEEPKQLDATGGDGNSGVGNFGKDFGEGLHGVQFGIGLLLTGCPGSERREVEGFELLTRDLRCEDGQIGVMPFAEAVGLADDGGVFVTGLVTNEVGPHRSLTEVPALHGLGVGIAGEFGGDFIGKQFFVGWVGFNELHDPVAIFLGKSVVSEVGRDFVTTVPPSESGSGKDGNNEGGEGEKEARHEEAVSVR